MATPHHRIDPASTEATRSPHQPRAVGWWPSALGLGAGLVLGDGADSGVLMASVVAVCALIYVAAAATGRRGGAWWCLPAAIVTVFSGRLTGIPMLPFLLMGVVAVVLIGVGWRRGAWSQPQYRWQLYGLAGFGTIGVAGAASDGTAAALLIAGGLVAHAAWDVVHLVRNAVVGRRYAELCAVLDAVLGAVILWRFVGT